MNIHPKFQCFVEDMAYLASRALYLDYNSFNINYVEAGSSWDFSPLAFVKERNELSFIEGTYDISINTQLLDRADLYDITFALFHEIRHIYQRQLIFECLEYEPDEFSWKPAHYAHCQEWIDAMMSYRKDQEKGMDCYDNNPLELDANAFAIWFFDTLFFGKTEPSGALTKERIKDYRSLYGRKVGKLRQEPLDDLLNAIPLKYTEFIVCDECSLPQLAHKGSNYEC